MSLIVILAFILIVAVCAAALGWITHILRDMNRDLENYLSDMNNATKWEGK